MPTRYYIILLSYIRAVYKLGVSYRQYVKNQDN